MCLATPQKILKIVGKSAIIDTAHSRQKRIDLSLLSEKVKPGDFILATHDIAIQRMSAAEAKQVFALIDESHHSHNSSLTCECG